MRDLGTASAYRLRLDASGLCRSCAERPARTGLRTCVECGAKSAAHSKASRARGRRPVGCRKCGLREHITKRHGRERYLGGRSGRPIFQIGPLVAKRMGIVTVVPVLSSWLVNP